MAHYALVNKDDIVLRVIVCDQDPINIDMTKKEAEDIQGRWLQTSYNTRGGVHYNQDGKPSGKPAFRENFAGKGDKYIEELDAFMTQAPGPVWILDLNTFQWKSPVDIPSEPLHYSSLKSSGSIISDSSPAKVKSI
jgi:hypothetical protein